MYLLNCFAIFSLSLIFPSNVFAHTELSLFDINKAYVARNIKKIDHINHKNKSQYWTTLVVLMRRYNKGSVYNFKLKSLDKYPCPTEADAEKFKGALTADLACLLIKSKAANLNGYTKYYYLYMSIAKQIYTSHITILKNDPKIQKSVPHPWPDVPPPIIVKKWPQTKFEVNSKWKPIRIDNGHVSINIGGKNMDIGIDTGTTGISLTNKYIKDHNLTRYLHPLPLTNRYYDGFGGGGYKVYYIKHIRLGPVHMNNAYVSVTEGGSSNIGLYALNKLGKFVYGKKSISHFSYNDTVSCSAMHFVRLGYLRAITYPFMLVQTSMGRMGLYFDSGETSEGPVSGVNIFASKKYFHEHKKNVKKNPLKTIPVSLTTNGRTIWNKIPIYNLKMYGKRVGMLVSPEKFEDPLVTGSIGSGILDKFSIAYDFEDGKMCLVNP